MTPTYTTYSANLNNQRHAPIVSLATRIACAERRLAALIDAGRPAAVVTAARAVVEALKEEGRGERK